jgi:hypothetical protein
MLPRFLQSALPTIQLKQAQSKERIMIGEITGG